MQDNLEKLAESIAIDQAKHISEAHPCDFKLINPAT